ncbi:MAG: bifunctional (p)ppGpp synthetase/guanosine-3',5'-bis(diphosphate) 3'-pyrophosphohydrolase, partial [Bacteroidaceae bacterium]|nr:bifunctional (p)ppGpp synthetase/guanosine-3',5'-bis(diphosphate) 3'-pyrophosphohydrolase [Bacteroidaceae bacterium]
MEEKLTLPEEEKVLLLDSIKKLQQLTGEMFTADDFRIIRDIMLDCEQQDALKRNAFGFNPIVFDLQTAIILAEEIGLNRASILSVLLHDSVAVGVRSIDYIKETFGDDVAHIIRGIIKVNELYAKNASIETENFRDLLLSFAEDMRVIFIIIADRVNLMRQIKDKGTEEERVKVATEASNLYAPLAHKLGLYLIKSELEDLSLKYLNPEVYYMIKEKLAETKKSRDKYIADFIGPIEEKLSAAGLRFHVKGRTKSIHS